MEERRLVGVKVFGWLLMAQAVAVIGNRIVHALALTAARSPIAHSGFAMFGLVVLPSLIMVGLIREAIQILQCRRTAWRGAVGLTVLAILVGVGFISDGKPWIGWPIVLFYGSWLCFLTHPQVRAQFSR